VESRAGGLIDITVKLRSNLNQDCYANRLVLKCRVPDATYRQVKICDFFKQVGPTFFLHSASIDMHNSHKKSAGSYTGQSAEYVSTTKTAVWKINKVYGSSEHTATIKLNLDEDSEISPSYQLGPIKYATSTI
jgi:hypothetical protein